MIQIKDLVRSSVYVTPNFPDITTKRYKISFYKMLGILSLYTLVVAFFLILLLMFTPANKILFLLENNAIKEQAEKVYELEEKVHTLTSELDRFITTNKKLNYALKLANTDSVKLQKNYYDSINAKMKVRNKKTNNIFYAFRDFLFFLQTDQQKIRFISPALGYVNNDFASEKGHYGIDFALLPNTVIMASASGKVVFSDFTAKDGNIIIIQHQDSFISVYKHCASLLKKEREYVKQGEIIALSGNSGYNTSGPHLHFEIWKNGKPVNPKKLLINLE